MEESGFQKCTMRYFNIFFCCCFMVLAVWNYRYPESYIWIPVFIYASVLCWLAFKHHFFSVAYLAGITVYLAIGVYKVFKTNGLAGLFRLQHTATISGTAGYETQWVEVLPAFAGLLTLVTVLTINYLYARRQRLSVTALGIADFYAGKK